MKHLSVLLLALALILPASQPACAEKVRLRFVGGPPGGSFEGAARALTQRLKEELGADVSLAISGGSVENLRRIHKGEADFGIVYAADLFLARSGQLPYDPRSYDRILALAPLYPAPAQLMVRADGGITRVGQLAGKRVAIGTIGSGTAATAQRFFTSIDLWDLIRPDFTGYQEAISALGHGYIDAIWVFAGLPNQTVVQAAGSYPVRLLDLSEDAEKKGFFTQYPFFSKTSIAPGTYPGIDYPVNTFQDIAVWVAGSHVAADTVRKAMAAAARSQGQSPALIGDHAGILTPLHPGAELYWQDMGKR
ncbi:TAXI family TRAP transporter solute-binding subunit [Geoalkalibacter sp.]|uniref:TAXI family TRAP transporter solute-binding subunit n=1 Tax=Geoalkalibacter sp. TaxID=3041440 RepID=UPI00272EADCF|nr:TAXI family TRAP transporter solute-binding subunit [Geoalkalibacter sp.]